MKLKRLILPILILIVIVSNSAFALQETREQKVARLYKDIPMDSQVINYLVNLTYKYDIDPDLVLSIIWCESNFDPLAKNKKSSASGYSQMIKSTAIYCANQIEDIKDYNHKVHAFDPYINLQLMVYYIDRCLNKAANNIDMALLYYRGCKDSKYINLVKYRMNIIKQRKKN